MLTGATPRPRYGLALAGYTVTALAVLVPLLPAFGAAIPGGLGAQIDGWQNVWNLWWTQRALAAGRNPFVTELLFFPEGAALYLQTLGLINGVVALPVTALWGPTAAYNVLTVAALALTGLAGYALALEVCPRRAAAFLAGLLLTLSPFHLTRVDDGQLELAALHWPAFATLFMARSLRAGRGRDTLLAGLLLACTGLSSWYYLVFLAPGWAALALAWPAAGRGERLRLLGRVAVAGLLAGLLLLPVALPALAGATGGRAAALRTDAAELRGRSMNLLDPLLPSYLHPLWGDAVLAAGQRWHDTYGSWNVSLGYGVIALAAAGAATDRAAARPWLAVAALAMLLALGPELRVGTWDTGLPLPYALLNLLPGLGVGRRPLLFAAVASIALVPPVALGARALLAAGARRPWLPPLALALLTLELLPRPWPLNSTAVHPYYATLAPGAGAVLEVPAARYKYVEPQRAQLVHGRPLVGGYLARSPAYDWVEEAPGLRALWLQRSEDGPPLVPGGAEDLVAVLGSYGVRDVVVRWDQIAPDRRPVVAAVLAAALPGLAPVYADAALSAYVIPPAAPGPFASLTRGWHGEERQGGRSWRWMDEEGTVLLVNPLQRPVAATLALRAQGYQGGRRVAMALDGAPLGHWEVGRGETTTALRLWLPPGAHRLSLRAEASLDETGSRRLSIALLDVRMETRPATVAP